MSGWGRWQLDRLIVDRERSGTTVCGLLLALAAAGLILTGPTRPSAVRRTEPTRAITSNVAANGEAVRRWTPADDDAAAATARAFLDGYLPYLYGQAPAGRVEDATTGFARALERGRRVVPPGIRTLHPRVVAIHASPLEPGHAIASALVSDGEVVQYPIRLVLTETARRWLVSGLEGAR